MRGPDRSRTRIRTVCGARRRPRHALKTERPAQASQTAGKVATYNWTDKDGQGGCYGGNLYNEIKGIWERADRNEKALAQLTALVAAQQTALDTLAKSLGANPADIAEIVAQAVTAKLDSIDVTFTATSK